MLTTAGNKNKNKKWPTTKPDLQQHCRWAGQAGSLAGVSKLWTALVRRPASRAIEKALAAEESYTLHRPVRYRFPRRQTIVSGPSEQLQCDLVDWSEYREANNGTRYLFCCIDLFSKYAWARPLTSKRGTETAGTMQAILDDMQNGPPLAVQRDKGTEMRAAPFQRLLMSRDIHFCRPWYIVALLANRTRRFVDVLLDLLRTYNSTNHSTIGMAPRAVN